MKKHLTAVLAALLLGATAIAQEKKVAKAEVPAPVHAAFAKLFPKASVIGYAQETENGKTLYEVASKEGTVHRDVSFLADGRLVVIEEEIPATDLPEPVRITLQKEKGQCVLAEKLTRGMIIEYEMHLRDGKREFEVLTDRNGKILKREPATKD